MAVFATLSVDKAAGHLLGNGDFRPQQRGPERLALKQRSNRLVVRCFIGNKEESSALDPLGHLAGLSAARFLSFHHAQVAP